MGMPPLRTALLRQTGGTLHARQPAGGVLKRRPISQVCSICAALMTQTNLSPCSSWARFPREAAQKCSVWKCLQSDKTCLESPS